jgi:3'(2'), 5'-bisphosphate nucleotidase
LIAEGRADLHPRFTPTSQWDTAAGDAVLRAAGGRVVTMDGMLLAYGGRTPSGAMTENPPLIALGGVAFRPPAA